jgi:hypothetical protein
MRGQWRGQGAFDFKWGADLSLRRAVECESAADQAEHVSMQLRRQLEMATSLTSSTTASLSRLRAQVGLYRLGLWPLLLVSAMCPSHLPPLRSCFHSSIRSLISLCLHLPPPPFFTPILSPGCPDGMSEHCQASSGRWMCGGPVCRSPVAPTGSSHCLQKPDHATINPGRHVGSELQKKSKTNG